MMSCALSCLPVLLVAIATSTPPFVGSDYYCETAVHNNTCCHRSTFFPNDPLWDGQQCLSEKAPCCAHPNMPCFNKTLSETTTEDIELRVCGDDVITDEDTPLEATNVVILLSTVAAREFQCQQVRLHVINIRAREHLTT